MFFVLFEFLFFYLFLLDEILFDCRDSRKFFEFLGDVCEIRLHLIVGSLQSFKVWFCGGIGRLTLIWDFLDSFLRFSDFLFLNVARFNHFLLELSNFSIYSLIAQHFQIRFLHSLIVLWSLLILSDLSPLLGHSFLYVLDILDALIKAVLSLICDSLNFFKYFSVFLLQSIVGILQLILNLGDCSI